MQKPNPSGQVKGFSIATMLIFCGFIGAQQYVTTFFSSLGMTSVGFISLLIVYTFFLIFCIVGSLVVSVYGAKKAIITGALFYIIFILSLSTGSASIVYLTSVLLGIGSGLVWVGQNTYVIRATEQKKYGTNTGTLASLQFLGQSLGIVAAGVLIFFFMYRAAFLLLAVVPIIGFILLFRIKDIREVPQKNAMRIFTKISSNILALRVAALGFSMFYLTGFAAATVPLEIKGLLGVSYIGPLAALFYIIPAISAYLFGRHSDVIGRLKMIPYSYLISIFGLVMLYFANSLLALALGILLIAINVAAIRPIGMALIGDISPKHTIEQMSGLYWAITTFGFVMSIATSILFPSRAAYLVAIVVMILSFLVIMPLLEYNLDDVRRRLAKHLA